MPDADDEPDTDQVPPQATKPPKEVPLKATPPSETPLGQLGSLNEVRETVDITIERDERTIKRPKSYMKKAFPYDVNKYHPSILHNANSAEKNDPQFLIAMLHRANSALIESTGTHRSDTWMKAKYLQRSINSDLIMDKAIEQDMHSRVEIVNLNGKLAAQQEQTTGAMLQSKLEVLKQLKQEMEHLRATPTSIVIEDHVECSNQCMKSTQIPIELDALLQRTHEVLARLCDADAQATVRPYRHFEQTAEQAIKMAETQGDARIARISYRNGLIDGAQAA